VPDALVTPLPKNLPDFFRAEGLARDMRVHWAIVEGLCSRQAG